MCEKLKDEDVNGNLKDQSHERVDKNHLWTRAEPSVGHRRCRSSGQRDRDSKLIATSKPDKYIYSESHPGDGVQHQSSPLLLSAAAEMKEFGWWQLRAILVVSLVKVPSAWQMASILFTAPNLEGPFWCTSSKDDPCPRTCDAFHFAQQPVTFVTQWSLVCGREVLVPVSQVSLNICFRTACAKAK
ncbi:hypothetical protein C0J52_03910 [Blattella germanica]|nr:hypothetical protein C0J52_03910 [Blattella germanica]